MVLGSTFVSEMGIGPLQALVSSTVGLGHVHFPWTVVVTSKAPKYSTSHVQSLGILIMMGM
jgi:hypothetical protein